MAQRLSLKRVHQAGNIAPLAANYALVGRRQGLNYLRLVVFSALTICLAISGWNVVRRATWQTSLFASAGLLNETREVELDQRLQTAATSALGDRRGTIILMDPQTGRVRAVVNSKLAFEDTLRPGSTIN